MKKKTAAKTDALYSALFRKKMAIESQKKCTRRARKLQERTGFIATSKLQQMKKLEKVSKWYTAENRYQDSILDSNRWSWSESISKVFTSRASASDSPETHAARHERTGQKVRSGPNPALAQGCPKFRNVR